MDKIIPLISSAQEAIKNFAQTYTGLFPYILFLVLFILFIGISLLLHCLIVRRFIRWSEKAKTPAIALTADMFRTISPLFYFALSSYLAVQFSEIEGGLRKVLFVFFLIMCVYEFVRIFEKIFLFLLLNYFMKSDEDEAESEKEKPAAQGWINILLKSVLWILAILFILNNLGIKITALAASLGVTSIAVAFALQNILSDIFSSVSIYLDKPFKENDFIQIGTDLGVVQKIGIKTTRLKTLQGEELVVSNHELTSVRIRNYKQMERRRIVFQIGVTYDTPIEKIRQIPEYLKTIVNAQEMAELDRTHFSKFGDYNLQFETVYYVNSGEYSTYMDVQQAVNLGILDKFKAEGIKFAFPTQTIQLEK